MSIMSDQCQKQPETILIVDDNEDTAGYIQALVEEAGYETIVVERGDKALEVVNRERVDLALLDVVMPGMSGITVANQLKQQAGPDFLPVILVTALASAADKVEGLTHADDYLTKPFSAEELIARIQSLLRIRRLNKELYQSKTRYECLYENFPHLYISVNSDRTITDCNRFFRETFGVTREEIIGKSFYSLFRDQDYQRVESFLNAFTISDVPSVSQRIFAVNRGEEGPPLQLNLKAVYTGEIDDGLSIVIAMEDVTEQLRLQDEQKLARLQLYRSARLASIGTLASGVAHEINNPLTAILGFSSALLGRIKEKETIEENDLEEYLEIINMEALRCRDIIENLSKFAREGDVETSKVNLRECVDDALKLNHVRASRANIKVTNTVDPEIIIKSDANRLEQVIINIILNCIDFCAYGSKVTIENVQTNEPDRYCRLQISDNGPGITPEIIPKVFDPFFTTKEVGKGTGMGLAICHKIMEECNGRIDIKSDLGNGTTVTLDLPISTKIETDIV